MKNSTQKLIHAYFEYRRFLLKNNVPVKINAIYLGRALVHELMETARKSIIDGRLDIAKKTFMGVPYFEVNEDNFLEFGVYIDMPGNPSPG